MQPARADAVGAILIFLHLLEAETDRRAELPLAQPEHVAAQPDPGTDVHVNRLHFTRFAEGRARYPPITINCQRFHSLIYQMLRPPVVYQFEFGLSARRERRGL